MKNIDILKDVKKIDTIETNVTQNTTDITSIQTDLSVTENSKYTTANGIKEFACGNGYIDNVVIEGETLVNLFQKTLNETHSDKIVAWDMNSTSKYSSGIYTIYNVSNKNIYIDIYGNNPLVWLRKYTINSKSNLTISLGDNENFRMIGGLFEDNWLSNDLDELNKTIVILKGDHTRKSVSYFEGLKSVGQGDKIEVLTRGVNIFDGVFESGSINAQGVNISQDNRERSSNFILIEPNSQYYLNKFMNIFEYDANKNLVKYTIFENSGVFTTQNNTRYIKIYTVTGGFEGFQINKGNTQLPYELPIYDKKQILSTLRSVDDTVKDIVYKQGDKYYKVKRCMEYNYNDLGNITYIYNESSKFSQFHIVFNKTFKNNIISNLLPSLGNYDGLTVFVHPSNSNTIVIRVPINYNTVDLVKPYLSSSNFTFVVELETPVIEELPNFNPRTFSDKSTILLNSGVVQGEASFEVTNSTRSELEVLKNKVSDLDNEYSEIYYPTLLNGWVNSDNNNKLKLIKTNNTVILQGFIQNPSTPLDGSILFTIPTKFTPKSLVDSVGFVTANNTMFGVAIDSNLVRLWAKSSYTVNTRLKIYTTYSLL